MLRFARGIFPQGYFDDLDRTGDEIMDFDEASKALTAFGIRWVEKNALINKITLPFDEIDWCRLCMREGDDYIGGCCGSMAFVQDLMNGVFRDSGDMDSQSLRLIGEAMISHHGVSPEWSFDKPPTVMPTPEEFGLLRTWDRLAVIWYIVRGHLQLEEPTLKRKSENDDGTLRHAIKAVANGAHGLDNHYLFQVIDHDPNPARETQKKATMSLTLARLLPALRTVLDRIYELDPGPFEGIAIVDPDNEVVTNGFGPCVYDKQESAEGDLASMVAHNKRYEDLLNLRPVRVSVAKGIEFL